MRVEGFFRSPNGGGVPFCMLSIYQAPRLCSRLSPESSSTPKGQKCIESGQKRGKTKHLFTCFCLTSGKSETENGKNKNIFYFRGFRGGGGGVHWVQVVRLFERSGPTEMPALVLWSCVPSLLSSLSLCLWWVALGYGSISRFKGVFSVFWGFRVGLCGLGALRGLCGFCARE